jgi:hypothetical protein
MKPQGEGHRGRTGARRALGWQLFRSPSSSGLGNGLAAGVAPSRAAVPLTRSRLRASVRGKQGSGRRHEVGTVAITTASAATIVAALTGAETSPQRRGGDGVGWRDNPAAGVGA